MKTIAFDQPKPVKIPGPDHAITIEANPARGVVTVAGRVAADSVRALTLRQAKYPPVQYIPRQDVGMSLLRRIEKRAPAWAAENASWDC